MTTITIERALLEQALVALSAPNHCVFSEPPICVDIRAALAAPATAPTQPAFESWCASMGFIPTQARYETWQATTAAAINKICADVQAAGFANGGIETPADVAPEILFQLKEKIEAATAAALAAPATAPAQPERKPMTKGQREQVARRAEAAMNGNVNLSWRDALISETEAFHDIKETP